MFTSIDVQNALEGVDNFGRYLAHRSGRTDENYTILKSKLKRTLYAVPMGLGIFFNYGCADPSVADASKIPENIKPDYVVVNQAEPQRNKSCEENPIVDQSSGKITVGFTIQIGDLKIRIGGAENERSENNTPSKENYKECPDMAGGVSLRIPTEVQRAISRLDKNSQYYPDAIGALNNALVANADFPGRPGGTFTATDVAGNINPVRIDLNPNFVDQGYTITDCVLNEIRKATH